VIFYPELESIDSNIEQINEAQKCIKKLKALSLNQITIVGGKEKAFFDSFVNFIPKPVLFPKNTATKELIEAITDLTKREGI
jgi:hypothetical protein